VGSGVALHFGVTFEEQGTLIGDDVWISAGVYVDQAEIEDHVLIGPKAVLLAGGHPHQTASTTVPIKLQGNNPKPTLRIGRGAWIGANATVMADVGHDAIVGAGAVVTRPVPPLSVVGGNPARIIRMRSETEVSEDVKPAPHKELAGRA
jgi:acetyltransferase-like isoleucine patch superfamily enzyme